MLERVKFLAITASNLDEFMLDEFMEVRSRACCSR
ncbi:MAG TPA: hypothetical protein VEI52_18140 [Terriglobales bacterium]|nr:hypothetical protein [Terriglobales bacterium]